MGRVVKRAYKYRFYPTPEQAELLNRTFGCVRLIYNRALAERTRVYATEGRSTSYVETSAWLTEWKASVDLAFLNEVSCVPLPQTLRHLHAGFAAFLGKRGGRYPRFKSKRRSPAAAEYTRSGFRWRDGQLMLAKMAQPLDIRWSRPLPEGAQPSTVTVGRDAAGRWFVSILVETTIEPLPPVEQAVGVDAGLDSLVTLSTGEKVTNPRYERRDRRKLVKAQRSLARKQKGSSNRAKARLRVARVHARIVDGRRDYLHKLSTRLVRENQTVAVEDLTVQNMVGNHRLARAIYDASWAKLRTMLEYKAEWYGRDLRLVDRWYPSSKICSECGALKDAMPLSIRSWTCPCGTVHDRDVNAARNILAAGLVERQNACRAGVRPQRNSFRAGNRR